jgi:PAS domain S-box-containing protein
MSSRLPRRDGRADLKPGRIALAYLVVGAAWILGSGYVVQMSTSGPTSEAIDVVKGWGFVVVTAAALYVLLARRASAIRSAELARLAADEERMRLAIAVEQAGEAIVITDREFRIVYVNPAFERVSGYTSDELVGTNPRQRQGGRHGPEFYEAMWSTLRAGGIWRGTLFNLRKDGGDYEVDAVISPLRNSDGTVESFVGVERDVTRERALERELAEAGRMEAVGQLAGGIAHDFNNLLTAIGGYAELLRNEVPADSESQTDVDEILRASRSAAGLVRQLLAFGRRQVLELAGLGLDVLVEQLRPMLAGLLGPSVALEVASPGSVVPVFADPGQIEQVLVNLAVNARDAMPDGGTFRISISNVEVAAEDKRLDSMAPGRYVVLAASDTGVGMDEATRAHAFEPFFTTKPAGRGTGLGLATTYGIVKQSGGYLFAESELGRGTTVTMYLPQYSGAVVTRQPAGRGTGLGLATTYGIVKQSGGYLFAESELGRGTTVTMYLPQYSGAVVTRQPEGLAEPSPGGSETVLVVEDDPAVKAIIRQALERLGYRVLVSSDAAEALAAAETLVERLPLLVSDIRLPGRGGPELAALLRVKHPGLRVLYVSGYAGDEMIQRGLLGTNEAFLAKPFSADDLARRVRSLLDGD